MRIHRDERAQTLILVALSLPILLGFIGMATDIGLLFMDKRQIQTAADSAAVAGALNLNYGSTSYTAAAKAASAANGYTDGSNNVTVTVHDPPTWPSSHYVSQTGYVEATVSKQESTFFLALFGHSSVTVTARAVATNGGPGAGCIYALQGTGIGFSITGNATVQANQCGLLVDSSASPPMNMNGNITLTMKTIGAVGSCGAGGKSCETGNVTVTPTPVSGIVPYSDPLSYLPQFTCSGGSCTDGTNTYSCQNDPGYSGNNTGKNSISLPPGCYTGFTASGNYTISLQSGNHIFNGPLKLNGNGTFSGSDVTLFMTSGTTTISGNTTLNLTAPTSGTYNGILFDGAGNTGSQTLNGNTGSTLEGIMYFPSSSLTMNGNGSTTLYTDFVAQSLSFIGNVSFNDYAALPGVTSPLGSIDLVE